MYRQSTIIFILNKIIHGISWDTSRVTNMSHTFYRTGKFDQNLNTWNVSNVEDMAGNPRDLNFKLYSSLRLRKFKFCAMQ